MRSPYINDIKNAKVIEVYELSNKFELVYIKDDIRKSLSIYHWCSFGPRGDGCWFELSGIALPTVDYWGKKTISKRLINIDTVMEINLYSKGHDNGGYEDLQIVYKNKENQICNYLLNSAPDEEEVHRLDIYSNKDSKLEPLENDSSATFPKELYSTQIYKNILAFALQAHKEQKTPEGLPYSFHIVSVANEIINSLCMHKISYDEANVAIACALLHDVNEDTEEEVSKYTIDFPAQNEDIVVSGVAALTKDETLPSKQEQMQDSLKRLKQMPYCVQMVKLADRITNLAPAPKFWNKAKRQTYVDEAKTIYEALKDSNPYLSDKLQYKIDNYEIEKDDDYIVFYGRTEEYSTKKIQLVLDKNHPKYLKTFKALNRLNEYAFKKYELTLFRQKVIEETYTHMPTKDGLENHQKVGVSYIMKVLNTKDLLDLNKQTDDKIAKYITAILEGEECILL